MVYNPRSRKEMVFANFSITHQNTLYPLNDIELDNKFAGYRYELYQEATGGMSQRYTWDEFLKYCLIEIQVFTSNTSNVIVKVPPKRYATDLEFLSTVNAVVPNSGGLFTADCQIKVYNVIDSSIPKVSKIYAYNHFYASLNSTSRLNKFSNLQEVTSPTFPATQDFVIQAWQQVWGRTITPVEYQADSANWNRTIWFQVRKTHNLYRLPAINVGTGTTCGSSINSSRRAYDESSSTLVPTVLDSTFRFERTKVATIGVTGAQAGINWSDDGYSETQSYENKSSIAVYGVIYGDQRAIYVKPLGGIDKWMISKFDDNLFRLEAVYTRPSKRERYKYINIPTDVSSGGSGHDSFTARIGKDVLWLGGKSTGMGKYVANQNNGWDVRFYLRRLDSDYVSEVGDSYIKADFLGRNKFSSLTYLVHRDNS